LVVVKVKEARLFKCYAIVLLLFDDRTLVISQQVPNGISAVSYEVVSKRFRTGRLERELQMVQLSATSCSCIAIL
jgi:hypothetical protein